MIITIHTSKRYTTIQWVSKSDSGTSVQLVLNTENIDVLYQLLTIRSLIFKGHCHCLKNIKDIFAVYILNGLKLVLNDVLVGSEVIEVVEILDFSKRCYLDQQQPQHIDH